MKQHSPQPIPIKEDFRSFFTEPESREFQDIRNSFVHLKQMQQKNLIQKQKLKLQSNEAKTQNVTINFKKITAKKTNKPQNIALDQSGQIIFIKKPLNQRNSLLKQTSLTVYNSPRLNLTSLNQVSSIYNNSPIMLKNQKLKLIYQPQTNYDQNNYRNNQIEKKIKQKLQSYQKEGVKIIQSITKHRASLSMASLKLPRISKSNASFIQRQSKQIR